MAASVASAQATYTSLTFRPSGISQDGTTLVGTEGGLAAFYDIATGTVSLIPQNAPGQMGNLGIGVNGPISADGSLTAGGGTDANNETVAARFDGTDWAFIGGLSSQSGNSVSSTYDMSNDGDVVVGLGWLGAGQSGAFHYSATTDTMVDLQSQVGQSARANGVNSDGSIVVGWDTTSRRPCIWPTGPGSGTFIGSLTTGDPTAGGECNATNDTGSIAVGWSFNDLGIFEAFSYEGGVMTPLGPHPTASPPSSQAYATSDDGSVIVGLGGNGFFGAQRGFIYTDYAGLQDATTFLSNAGANLGFDVITQVNGVSGDGRIVCGLAGSFPFFSGFWAELPQEPVINYCVGKASTAGCVASMTTSNPSASPVGGANDYSFVLTGAEGLRNGIFFTTSIGPGSAPFQGGTLCITPPLKRSLPMNTGGTLNTCNGSFSMIVNDGNPLPPGGSGFEGMFGQSTWTQAWYRSPGLGDSFDTALSDGIEVFWL